MVLLMILGFGLLKLIRPIEMVVMGLITQIIIPLLVIILVVLMMVHL